MSEAEHPKITTAHPEAILQELPPPRTSRSKELTEIYSQYVNKSYLDFTSLEKFLKKPS